MRRYLPLVDESILDNIGVATPCTADWSRMKGDDRVRHCGECRQNVYNLSAMSRREAAELVAYNEGRLCVRLLQRPDGTLITRDCRELLRRAWRRGAWTFMVTLVVLGLLQIGLKVWGVRTLVERWSEMRYPQLLEPASEKPRTRLGGMGKAGVGSKLLRPPPARAVMEPPPRDATSATLRKLARALDGLDGPDPDRVFSGLVSTGQMSVSPREDRLYQRTKARP